ncbi:hypothetical protein J6X13_02825 [Candidatus Saccharibacteria bacterium]|nr:hypothetical protein [Candidatus Saccharibacteria bacterium]
MDRPTKKQQELLDYIASYTYEHGYSPTYREIMTALKKKSVSAVAEHVQNCVDRGFLEKTDNVQRSLRVIPIEQHEETANLFKAKIEKLEALSREDPDNASVKDDLATLRAAAKLLGLTI